MKIYFSIEELCIEPHNVPQHVATKLMKHHAVPMSLVREVLNMPLTASKKSGYRSKAWELSKGRDGSSMHTFTGLGAVDWTFANVADRTEKNFQLLVEVVSALTNYTRISYYREAQFLHCDYKNLVAAYYEYDIKTTKWQFKQLLAEKYPYSETD